MSNGRGKPVRLCLMFILAVLLSVIVIVRYSMDVPSPVSKYIDIAVAVLMVVLLLLVLESCLDIELCGGFFCGHGGRARDAEGRGNESDPPTPEPSEAPPSYDAIMAQGGAEAHTGAAEGGLERRSVRESISLKRSFSFLFKTPTPEEERSPPVRPLSSPGVSETSFVTSREILLAVDGLPSYEEAVARQWEEDEEEEEEEEQVTVQEGEARAVNHRIEGAEATPP